MGCQSQPLFSGISEASTNQSTTFGLNYVQCYLHV
ncbi:hypothetical protein COLO4_16634 [Corchorus olitorius]|uniref:Uncharacterized protein n=1 Tax=Corchorus olitorius TaxID=93759 RepID=A0A1R3JG72_9ROSI|nr:hypothetical protein COLO4_16634 [Corchorus olitorius]